MAKRKARNDRKETAAVMLARGMTTTAVAKELGLTPRAVRWWVQKPEFQARVAELRREMIAGAVAVLSGLSKTAAVRLGQLMKSKDDRVALRASITVLETLVRLREHTDLDERLAALEAQAMPLAQRNGAYHP